MKKPDRRTPKARQTQKPKATNQVRIIGGAHRRRQIGFVDADGLRPTPDRLRETIFNWLTGHINGARVLDACAGSGVLAFEALSRGAMHATLIEASALQAKQLKASAELLHLGGNCDVIHGHALAVMVGLDTPFDIVFIDPPYALDLWQPLMRLLVDRRLIHADSLIYLEADRDIDSLICADLLGRFEIYKSTQVGQAKAYLLSAIDDLAQVVSPNTNHKH